MNVIIVECWYGRDLIVLFFVKQKTAYEMRISDWSSDVCSTYLIVAVEDARFFKQPHGAVNGRDRDAAVDLRCAFIEGLDIGMILRIRDDARDDAAPFGDAQPLFVAQGFETAISGHA